MKKSLIRTIVGSISLAVLTSMLLLNTFVMHVNAQPTNIEVNPSSLTIDEVGGTGTVNITVTDVTDLWMWQIQIYFDPAILNFTSAWYPSDHVFAGQPIASVDPIIASDAVGTYLQYGCSFMGATPGVDVDRGTMCQINFTGIDTGTSDLTFSTPLGVDTYLWDSYLDDIEFTVSDGEITVIPEIPTYAVIPLLMILTLVAVIIAKRKGLNKL